MPRLDGHLLEQDVSGREWACSERRRNGDLRAPGLFEERLLLFAEDGGIGAIRQGLKPTDHPAHGLLVFRIDGVFAVLCDHGRSCEAGIDQILIARGDLPMHDKGRDPDRRQDDEPNAQESELVS